MKRFIVFLPAIVLLVFALTAHSQQGPLTATHPEVTATQCAAATPVAANQTTLLAASTSNPGTTGPVISNRLCYIVQNFSGANPVSVGDSVSATQGVVINPVPAAQSTSSVGGTATVCTTSALLACGINGSAVVGFTEITR